MLTKWWKLELTLATNFGSHAQMVTKFGGQILATKFGFVPDWSNCKYGVWLNTLRPRQNGRHFPDDIFKCIFLNENVWIPIQISLKFVPMGPINNIPALVQIMAWRRLGDKPLSEPMMVSLLTHICVTRPQWVNQSYFIFYLFSVRHGLIQANPVNFKTLRLRQNGRHFTHNIFK